MYLPDTNVFIQALNKVEPENSFLENLILKNGLFISCVTISEFLVKGTDEERDRFEYLLAVFPVLDVNLEVARVAADYRKMLIKRRSRILLLDCFVAAQAKVHHLTLVTNNKADFPMKDIKIITPKN